MKTDGTHIKRITNQQTFVNVPLPTISQSYWFNFRQGPRNRFQAYSENKRHLETRDVSKHQDDTIATTTRWDYWNSRTHDVYNFWNMLSFIYLLKLSAGYGVSIVSILSQVQDHTHLYYLLFFSSLIQWCDQFFIVSLYHSSLSGCFFIQ